MRKMLTLLLTIDAILAITAVLLANAEYLAAAAAAAVLFGCGLAVALVWAWRVCRCPCCGKFLPHNSWLRDSFCPYCGEKIKVES